MARNKTAHRKSLEAHNKAQVAARAAVVAEFAEGESLKANAQKNAKAAVRASSKAKS
jgi:hypothetical protein